MLGWGKTGLNMHLGGLLINTYLPDRVVVGEIHSESVRSGLPRRPYRTGNQTFPLEHVSSAIRKIDRFGYKTEGMVSPPLLTLFLQSVHNQLCSLASFHHATLPKLAVNLV